MNIDLRAIQPEIIIVIPAPYLDTTVSRALMKGLEFECKLKIIVFFY